MSISHKSMLLLLFTLQSVYGFSQSLLTNYDQFYQADGIEFAVEDMVQDDNGFFWLATKSGLFRFDGVQFVKIYLPVPDSLIKSSENTYDISYDKKNQKIWLGTESGIFQYDLRTEAIIYLSPKDFFDDNELEIHATHVVFADRQGKLWAEFGKYGLIQISLPDKKAEVFSLPLNRKAKANGFDEISANRLRGISQDPNYEHILWINTRRGLMRFDKKTKQLQRYFYYPENEKMLIEANTMTCHYAHSNGYIYIGTWDAGLLKFDPESGAFIQFLLNNQPWKETVRNTHRVRSIVADKTGNLWINGSGGGAMFDVIHERFLSPLVTGGNVHFQDRAGNYWQFKPALRLFHRLKNQGYRVEFPKTFPCEQITGLGFDELNREIFFTTFFNDGAFWALNSEQFSFQRYPLAGRVGERIFMGSRTTGPIGYFAVENLNNELYLRRAGRQVFERIPMAFPPNSGHLGLACAPNGDLFATGHEGWLFWLKPPDTTKGSKQWEVINYTKTALGGSLPDDFYCVSSPLFDDRGQLWLRTCFGFSIFSPADGSFRHFSHQLKNKQHLNQYFYFVSDGRRMWVSGSNGFGWLDIDCPEDGLQKLYKPEGAFKYETIEIRHILDGKLWLHTSEGWATFDIETEKFKYYFGTKSNYAVFINDGRLALLEGNGLRIVHLDSLRSPQEIPRPYVSWFKVFEKNIPLGGALLQPRSLRLQADENFFSFGYSALAGFQTQDIRFAYQLEGVDPNWIYPEPGARTASYTNIDGGDYVLKIKTTDYRGEWLDNTYEMKIHVATPWWKTWWARFLLLSLIVSLVYWMVQNRFRQQQILLENQRLQLNNEQTLRNERDRIAAEMHDDLGAGLSTIRFLSLAAKEHEPDPAKAARIDKIAAQASQVMEKMADIIWVMNSRNDTLDNFSAYLRRYAAEYLETHGMRFEVEVNGLLHGRKLSGEQRRSLLLAVKECLHNTVKHAAASTAWLTIHAGDVLEITVADNGKGLPEELLVGLNSKLNTLTGNGLYNIRQRMRALGGEAVFKNDIGAKILLQMRFTN